MEFVCERNQDMLVTITGSQIILAMEGGTTEINKLITNLMEEGELFQVVSLSQMFNITLTSTHFEKIAQVCRQKGWLDYATVASFWAIKTEQCPTACLE
jgi:hypothetical protein